MKQLFRFSLMLLAFILPAAATAHDFVVDGIYYNINGSEATITYKGTNSTQYSNEYSGDVSIPSTVTYNGATYSVTSIGEKAFLECSRLTSIDIPNSVTTIGNYAFYGCSGLTSITIPNSVTFIGDYAFYNCLELSGTLTIPNSITEIGSNIFFGCSSLTSIIIPNSVTSIGYSSFSGCSGLKSVSIGNSVMTISTYAFQNCSGLTSIVIPDSVKTIGYQAFNNCSSLKSLTIGNAVKNISGNAFQGCTALEILNYNAVNCADFSGTEGGNPFYNLNITTIIIGDSVQRIPAYFAYGLSQLASVTVSNSVTSIGGSAFWNTPWFNDLEDGLVYIGKVAYRYKGIMPAGTIITLRDGTTEICSAAFNDCSGLAGINIPTSVTSIGGSAFYACSGLTSIDIPNSVTSIGGSAFMDCSGLTRVNIPNSITTINDYTFYRCSSLTSVTIPNSVTSIGYVAFRECDRLTSVTIGSSVTYIDDYAFGYCNQIHTLLFNAVNCSRLGGFSGYNFHPTVQSLQFGDSVEHISTGLPSFYMKNKTLIIPNSVKTIAAGALDGTCAAVVIGNGIESIGAGTFPWGASVVYATTAEPQPCEAGAFANPKTLYVPAGSRIKYFTAPGWSEFTNIIEGEYNAATKIELDCDSVTLYKDSSIQLSATVLPDSTSSTSIGWYSLSVDVASVSDDGKVYANGVGETDIIVWMDQVSDTCHVKVTPIMVETVLLSTHQLSMSLNETYTLTANVAPYNADNSTLEWIIPENDFLLTQQVNNNSLNIGAAGEGTITITVRATDGSGVCATCEVFVSANTPVKNLTLSPETLNLYVGYSEQLNAIITPQDAYIQELRWMSSNTSVATVDNNGRVTGCGVGNATITAVTTDGSNLSATCVVTVTNIPVESVTLDCSEIEMYEGNSTYLYATVLPYNAMNQTLRWESSNPRVATVSSNGRVNALEVGTTIITASSTDGTDISAACRINVINYMTSNCFSMPDSDVLHGESVTIPVRLTNDQNILAFQTNIYLPKGFTMATNEDDEFIITPSDRLTSDHILMADRLGDGGIRVICYTPQEVPISGYEGDLFYITITAPEYAAHDYAINLRNSLLTNTYYQELTIPDAGAVLTVNTFMMGDANDSHSVTVTDIVVTAQYVLGRNPSPFIFEAADMNGDGNITVTDIMLIVYLINHPTINMPKRMPALEGGNDSMSGEDVTLMAGETRKVSIQLNNEMDYTAFQLDLQLPDGLTASNFQLTDRACSHAFDVNTLGNGKTRALCYSPAIEVIDGHEGDLLTFDVTATDDIKGIITVDGIELVTADCQTVLMNSFTIGVNSATSVNELNGAKTVARVDYFNLAGQQIDRPGSGVTLVVTTYTDGTRSTTKVIK